MSAAPSRAAAARAATDRLRAAGAPEPAREARLLLRWACGLSPEALSAAPDAALSADEAARFEAGVARRCARAPLSHVTGRRSFWGRAFIVTPDVLDPRPETETLVATALEGPPAARVLDLGVGSGAILLSLLAAWPAATGLGIDASPAALAVARRNAWALGLAARARFAIGDWLAGVTGRFDLIVSNPPYLRADDLAAASPELAHEPALALDGGPDGLAAYRRIAAAAACVLAPGGAVLVETGIGQADAVAALFAQAGLAQTRAVVDLDGRARVVRAAQA